MAGDEDMEDESGSESEDESEDKSESESERGRELGGVKERARGCVGGGFNGKIKIKDARWARTRF